MWDRSNIFDSKGIRQLAGFVPEYAEISSPLHIDKAPGWNAAAYSTHFSFLVMITIMSKSYPVKITFHFPKFSGKSKRVFIEALISSIPLDPKIGYAGFSYKKYLRKQLMHRYSYSDIGTYEPLTLAQEEKIKKILLWTAGRASQTLPSPVDHVSVFVFPLLGPFDDDDRAMGFSTGFCPYKNSILIFLAPQLFVHRSLKGSLAHEYNHAIFFNYHDTEQTLLETIIFEGLAEKFEEEVVGLAPYAIALTKKEAMRVFNSMSSQALRSKNHDLYKDVFFGGKKYQKWTGYSIGYWIVKSFKKKRQNLSWQEIMKIEPLEIVEESDFAKR